MTPVTGPIERLCRPKCEVTLHNEKLILHDISHSVIITHSQYEQLNYRPICLANVFTKVIENVLLSRLQNWLSTTCSQFGFKAKHGTEMCVFILKELVRYYVEHGSCMYVTYLDASKAFDRVNHQKLFSKLIEAGAPRWCVRILCHWYCNQSLCVR